MPVGSTQLSSSGCHQPRSCSLAHPLWGVRTAGPGVRARQLGMRMLVVLSNQSSRPTGRPHSTGSIEQLTTRLCADRASGGRPHRVLEPSLLGGGLAERRAWLAAQSAAGEPRCADHPPVAARARSGRAAAHSRHRRRCARGETHHVLHRSVGAGAVAAGGEGGRGGVGSRIRAGGLLRCNSGGAAGRCRLAGGLRGGRPFFLSCSSLQAERAAGDRVQTYKRNTAVASSNADLSGQARTGVHGSCSTSSAGGR